MRRDGNFGPRVVFAGAVVLAAVGTARSANTTEPCCFTNQSYSGVCRVVPEQDESCAGILAYLNDPNSSGKSYCGSSATRGGWEQVRCPD